MPRNKSKGRANGLSVKPAFRPRGPRETSWGGDGAVVCADSVRVRLPYEAVLEPAATTGSLYLYQFRGNSVYDPDYTGAGGQAAGFDQWAAFFNEYTVISSSLEIEYISGQNYSVEVVTFPSYNVTSPASSLDASARPYAERSLQTGNGNATHKILRSSMSTAQMMGVREEAILDDDQYGATVSTNPGSSAIWYWNIVAQNVSNTTTLNDCVRVHIIFDVLFHDRIQLSLSAMSAPRRAVENLTVRDESTVLLLLSEAVRQSNGDVRAIERLADALRQFTPGSAAAAPPRT